MTTSTSNLQNPQSQLQSQSQIPTSPDTILIDTLRLSACLGTSCDPWGHGRKQSRTQPIELTVYLHLHPSYLDAAARSDDVRDSVHYGLLTKAISGIVQSPRFSAAGSESSGSVTGAGAGDAEGNGNGDGLTIADDLMRAVSECAFSLGGDSSSETEEEDTHNAIVEVRIILALPKMVLLASGGLTIDTTFSSSRSRGSVPDLHPGSSSGGTQTRTVAVKSKKVSVHDLVLPVIIGVNPPEREEKQRVVINVTFYENVNLSDPGPNSEPDYQRIISNLVKELEPTSYLTLEKFVMHIVRFACLASAKIAAVTARAQKPSALSFAQSSGVEITRERSVFM